MPTHPPHPPFPSLPSHFSSQKTMLDPRTELPNNHVSIFDPIGHINDSYDSYAAVSFGAKARKTAQNYENYRGWNGGGIQFRPERMEDESGVCSPPLWRTSPPISPVHVRNSQSNFRSLSPTSRAQVIARGQWELMEMVKNMPESSYELSLKDIVERPRLEESVVEERNFGIENRVKERKSEKKGKMVRSGSIDNRGLFLKMVFPFSFGSKKKKNSATNTCAKVSPKPEGASDKFSKCVEKDWWKKRFSGSGESESGVTSSSSGSSGSSGSSSSSHSNRRKKSCCLPGCSPFFRSKKSKSAK